MAEAEEEAVSDSRRPAALRVIARGPDGALLGAPRVPPLRRPGAPSPPGGPPVPCWRVSRRAGVGAPGPKRLGPGGRGRRGPVCVGRSIWRDWRGPLETAWGSGAVERLATGARSCPASGPRKRAVAGVLFCLLRLALFCILQLKKSVYFFSSLLRLISSGCSVSRARGAGWAHCARRFYWAPETRSPD